MKYQDYITTYIGQSRIEQSNSDNPEWLKMFFLIFGNELENRIRSASKGNRTVVSGSFAEAFPNLIPNEIVCKKEVMLNEVLETQGSPELKQLLSKKRIDFVLSFEGVVELIEFKTNLQFNDLSAAMIEMAIIRKFGVKQGIRSISTSSLHLYSGYSNSNGLRELNLLFDSPLDNIWLFCNGPELTFNINEILNFRNHINQMKQ